MEEPTEQERPPHVYAVGDRDKLLHQWTTLPEGSRRALLVACDFHGHEDDEVNFCGLTSYSCCKMLNALPMPYSGSIPRENIIVMWEELPEKPTRFFKSSVKSNGKPQETDYLNMRNQMSAALDRHGGFPTKDNILGAIKQLAAVTKKNDVAYIHLFTHGGGFGIGFLPTWMTKPSLDVSAGYKSGIKEETFTVQGKKESMKILTMEQGKNESDEISKGELEAVLREFNPEANVVVTLDTCHAASLIPENHSATFIYPGVELTDISSSNAIGEGFSFTSCLADWLESASSYVEDCRLSAVYDFVNNNYGDLLVRWKIKAQKDPKSVTFRYPPSKSPDWLWLELPSEAAKRVENRKLVKTVDQNFAELESFTSEGSSLFRKRETSTENTRLLNDNKN